MSQRAAQNAVLRCASHHTGAVWTVLSYLSDSLYLFFFFFLHKALSILDSAVKWVSGKALEQQN